MQAINIEHGSLNSVLEAHPTEFLLFPAPNTWNSMWQWDSRTADEKSGHRGHISTPFQTPKQEKEQPRPLWISGACTSNYCKLAIWDCKPSLKINANHMALYHLWKYNESQSDWAIIFFKKKPWQSCWQASIL